MKKTPAVAKKSLARAAPAAVSVASIRTSTLAALESLAAALTEVKPEEYTPAWAFLGQLEDAVEGMKKHMRGVIEGFVLESGRPWGEKGGREVLFPNGEAVRIRLHRTGIDPRKLEAMLRTRNIDPSKCMDVKITYSANQEKVAAAVRDGVLTEADVEASYYDATWVVQK